VEHSRSRSGRNIGKEWFVQSKDRVVMHGHVLPYLSTTELEAEASFHPDHRVTLQQTGWEAKRLVPLVSDYVAMTTVQATWWCVGQMNWRSPHEVDNSRAEPKVHLEKYLMAICSPALTVRRVIHSGARSGALPHDGLGCPCPGELMPFCA
jgi:hypothetical protein